MSKKIKKSSEKKSKLVLHPVIILLVLLGLVFFFLRTATKQTEELQEDAAQAELQPDDMVHIFQPQPDELIEFPFIIRGEAKAEWYEDDVFPVRVLSEVGTVLANGVAESRGSESAGGYIGFEVTLEEFDTADWEFGTLVMIQSDPLQFSVKNQVILPIRFVE